MPLRSALLLHKMVCMEIIWLIFFRTKFHMVFLKYLFTVCSFSSVPIDPCNPSPCGTNTQCINGKCSCLPEFQGDPYSGCQPECTLSSDCERVKACIRNKCKDPCPGTCASNALCNVVNHIPMCSCPERMTGNAFIQCHLLSGE